MSISTAINNARLMIKGAKEVGRQAAAGNTIVILNRSALKMTVDEFESMCIILLKGLAGKYVPNQVSGKILSLEAV